MNRPWLSRDQRERSLPFRAAKTKTAPSGHGSATGVQKVAVKTSNDKLGRTSSIP
jgi:hypothetical protein